MEKTSTPTTPPISKELLAYLESILPSKDFRPKDSHTDIMFYAGQREVVNILKQLHLSQGN